MSEKENEKSENIHDWLMMPNQIEDYDKPTVGRVEFEPSYGLSRPTFGKPFPDERTIREILLSIEGLIKERWHK